MKFIKLNKNYYGLVVLLLLWAAVVCFIFFFTLSQSASGSSRLVPIYSVNTQEKKAALTFNCAWGDETTDEVLQILGSHNIKCTFFVVGDFANKFPESIKKIYNAGHEIANHSLNHSDPVKLGFDEITTDIAACNAILEKLTGAKVTLYRAPSGSYNNKTIEAAKSLNMKSIQWNVDSIDWKNPSAETIHKRVLSKTQPGSIVLFHLGKENTLNALNGIIAELAQNGYTLCTVSELVYETNYTVDRNGVQHSTQ